jgi:hypothetical protein
MILFSCKDASHICDKAQYREAKPLEKWLMKLHHLVCRVCREHAVRNTRLSYLLRDANLHVLPKHKKDALKGRIREQLSREP